MLKKYEPTCIFCGSNKKLASYKNKQICFNCAMNIKKAEQNY